MKKVLYAEFFNSFSPLRMKSAEDWQNEKQYFQENDFNLSRFPRRKFSQYFENSFSISYLSEGLCEINTVDGNSSFILLVTSKLFLFAG